MFLRTILVVVTLFGLLSNATIAAAQKVQVSIDPSRPGVKIDRNLFGQFAEHLGHGIYEGIWVGSDSTIPNTRGIRNDVVAALKAIHVPNVRWPGGCFADEYHWRDGIGPQRVVRLNPNWGGVIEPNTFGTHEFMDFIGQIGSEAYVSVNVGSGTPQEASDWLEYMTAAQATTLQKERAANGHPAPYKIALLGLGNESWDCGGNMTPDYYLDRMKVFSRFVRNYNPAQTDKNQMLKIAVGPGGGEERWTEWTDTVMKAYQKHTWSWDINGLSMHSYTTVKWPPAYKSVGFGEDEYAQILKSTLEMEDLVKKHSAIMDKYDPEKKVALIVDEWGSWYAPLPGSNPGFLVQQNSIRDAILAALNINIFARHSDRVRGANIAQMINVLQAMIITDKEKMVLTPTYYVYKMYLPFQDATFVPVTFDAGTYKHGDSTLPRIDALAARGKDGKLWLEITNVDPNQTADVELNVTGFATKSASGETLAGPKVDSVNTFEAPNTVVPKPTSARVEGGKVMLKLEPKSVTVVSLEQ
ncbi:Alpha-L-arabinofuranosidase [Candidatus Koribacter versatilis Ellin345]|uniref:non-reducing end alpha-L-arabinofuranosidase n=1 Tax=Koribacter versatilis (strain Ellin345) TaxID=204669 RepID=Q1ITP2_KORVE|nr:alpha-L-arabinofuranosidase C-terminal domain-containing protein [Candidatus Koribacter versatilis]ABF39758.1 Alpha-L-arabinofuranosidase [Candidatus Koribacter versatilis Ellin345]